MHVPWQGDHRPRQTWSPVRCEVLAGGRLWRREFGKEELASRNHFWNRCLIFIWLRCAVTAAIFQSENSYDMKRMLALNKVDFTLTRRTAAVRAFNLHVGTVEVGKKMERDFEILRQTEGRISEVTFSFLSVISTRMNNLKMSLLSFCTPIGDQYSSTSCCYHELLRGKKQEGSTSQDGKMAVTATLETFIWAPALYLRLWEAINKKKTLQGEKTGIVVPVVLSLLLVENTQKTNSHTCMKHLHIQICRNKAKGRKTPINTFLLIFFSSFLSREPFHFLKLVPETETHSSNN